MTKKPGRSSRDTDTDPDLGTYRVALVPLALRPRSPASLSRANLDTSLEPSSPSQPNGTSQPNSHPLPRIPTSPPLSSRSFHLLHRQLRHGRSDWYITSGTHTAQSAADLSLSLNAPCEDTETCTVYNKRTGETFVCVGREARLNRLESIKEQRRGSGVSRWLGETWGAAMASVLRRRREEEEDEAKRREEEEEDEEEERPERRRRRAEKRSERARRDEGTMLDSDNRYGARTKSHYRRDEPDTELDAPERYRSHRARTYTEHTRGRRTTRAEDESRHHHHEHRELREHPDNREHRAHREHRHRHRHTHHHHSRHHHHHHHRSKRSSHKRSERTLPDLICHLFCLVG